PALARGSREFVRGAPPLPEGATRIREGGTAPSRGLTRIREGRSGPRQGATKIRQGRSGPRAGDTKIREGRTAPPEGGRGKVSPGGDPNSRPAREGGLPGRCRSREEKSGQEDGGHSSTQGATAHEHMTLSGQGSGAVSSGPSCLPLRRRVCTAERQ